MTSTTVQRQVESTTATGRASWAWAGAAAGALGAVTNLVLAVDPADGGRTDVSAVDALTRGPFHAAAITGYLAVACLLVFAAGLWRWAEGQTSTSLALRVPPLALTASAAALVVGYGVKGQLAEYLPGGMNPDNFPPEGLYVFLLLDDLGGYVGWTGVTVALAALAWLSLRERLLPRWIGAVAALATVPPLLFLLLTGFTGFSGISGPVALLVVGVGMALRRD